MSNTEINPMQGDENNTKKNEEIKGVEIECSSPAITKRPQKQVKNYTEDGHADVFFDPYGLL